VLSAGACSSGSHPSGPISPSFFINQGKIYVQSYTTTSNSLTVFRADNGKSLWQATYDGYSQPVTDNTTIYFTARHSTESTLMARDIQSGKERWHVSTDAIPRAVSNGILYAYADAISAFQANNGKHLWTTVDSSAPLQVQQVKVEQELVYVVGIGGVSVLQAADGKFLWSFSRADFSGDFASANGTIYLTRNSGELDAFNASNGNLLWTFSIKGLPSSPLLLTSDGILCVQTIGGSSSQDEIYGLRADDGVQLWQQSGDLSSIFSNKTPGVLYGKSVNRGIVALSAQDGTELWHFNLDQLGGGVIDLDEKSGALYINLGSSVAALGTDGHLLWEVSLQTDESGYQVSSGVVYQLIPGGSAGDSKEQHYTQADLTATLGSDRKPLWSTHFQLQPAA